MPYVCVKVIENVFLPEVRAEMIHGITEAVVVVEGEGVRNQWCWKRSAAATGLSAVSACPPPMYIRCE